jgi:hypothetical protein
MFVAFKPPCALSDNVNNRSQQNKLSRRLSNPIMHFERETFMLPGVVPGSFESSYVRDVLPLNAVSPTVTNPEPTSVKRACFMFCRDIFS